MKEGGEDRGEWLGMLADAFALEVLAPLYSGEWAIPGK